MRRNKGLLAGLFLLGFSVAGMVGTTVAAEEYYDDYYYGEEEYYEDEYYEEEYVANGDNSLYSLGLNSEYKCSPEFAYDTLEYNVTVPEGTTTFDFDPVKSADSAEISEITGTKLDEDGNGTVKITVKAENGAEVTYYLYVTSKTSNKKKKAKAETEAIEEVKETEKKEKAKETEQTESASSKKDKEALAAAESEKLVLQAENEELAQKVAQLEQKETKATILQGENDDLAYRLDLLMKVLYGLIGFAVILLFFIINQSLRNKDLKDAVKKAKNDLEDVKATAPTTDTYYAPVQQQSAAQPEEPVFVPAEEEPALSKRQQKKLAKEAKKAAKIQAKKKVEKKPEEPAPAPAPKEEAPAPQPEEPAPAPKEEAPAPQPGSNEPQLVKGSVNEPDVKVNMIDL